MIFLPVETKVGDFFRLEVCRCRGKGHFCDKPGTICSAAYGKRQASLVGFGADTKKTKTRPRSVGQKGGALAVSLQPMGTEGRNLLHVFSALDGDLDDFGGIEFTIAAFGGFCHGTCEVSESLPRDGFGA